MITKTDLKKYGISDAAEIVYNPSYDELFREETKPGLEGFEKGQLTDMGAVNVMTGVYTGRSPKDKFFVLDDTTRDTIWWTSDEYKNDNKPVTGEAWKELKKIAADELSGKKLYVVDTFCGANENTRLKIRFIMEVAWQAHFVKNMFIRPTDAELEQYGEPDFVVLNASKAKVTNYKELGLNSETAVVFNLTEKMQVIINTWYGGEMKKGMFSYMNYLLPLKGIASMHCSANTNEQGETAIFFGLSGTGKTTLSTDPKRQLIGDDEHGWDDDGVFNFEGGCYAKVINLSKENEPDIWNAIRRNALLENVTVNAEGAIDFADKSVTENTRVSYPIYHIENIVKPVSKAPAARKVIFLSADAFGVLPPVSILTPEQTKYYFLSGFTAKLAGTERGITEPTPTFSACFGAAFLAAPHQVRRGAGEAHEAVGRHGLPGEHRLERHRQAHLHQGHPRHHRRHPRRFDRQGADQDAAHLRLQDPDRTAGRRSRHPRPARHLRGRRGVGAPRRGSGRTLREELHQVHGQRRGQEPRSRRTEDEVIPPASRRRAPHGHPQ